MIVLDTNVISETFRRQPEPRVVEWLTSLTDDVAITTITLAELFAGVRRLPEGRRKSALESNIHAALLPFRATRSILSFDESAAEAYAEITADRERAGLPISMADAQIAPDSCHRGTSVGLNAEGVEDALGGVGEWVAGVVLVTCDRDGDLLQGS